MAALQFTVLSVEGSVKGKTIKLWFGESSMIFPFNPTDTVNKFRRAVTKDTEQKCNIVDMGTFY